MLSNNDSAITYNGGCNARRLKRRASYFPDTYAIFLKSALIWEGVFFGGIKSPPPLFFRWIHLQMMLFMQPFLWLSGRKVWDFALLFFRPL